MFVERPLNQEELNRILEDSDEEFECDSSELDCSSESESESRDSGEDLNILLDDSLPEENATVSGDDSDSQQFDGNLNWNEIPNLKTLQFSKKSGLLIDNIGNYFCSSVFSGVFIILFLY